MTQWLNNNKMYFHLISLTLNISLANVSSGFWHLPWWNETHTVIPFLGWEILCFKQHCGSCLGSLELEGHLGLHLQPMASHLSSQSLSFFISKEDRNYNITRLLWGFLLLFGSKLCLTLCNPMDCSTPGFSVLHYLPELAQTHVHWVSDVIPPSYPLSPPYCSQSFPVSGSFPMNWLFTSGGQSIGASASASVLPMNIQGLFPLGLAGLISL